MVRKLAEECHERAGELLSSQVTTKKEIEAGKEVIEQMTASRAKVERNTAEAIEKVEAYYNEEMEKLNSTEAQVVVQLKELEAGYRCIDEALTSARDLRNLMQTAYDMLVTANGTVDNLGHLFEDLGARSMASMKSAKERTLEQMMEKKPKQLERRSSSNWSERKGSKREKRKPKGKASSRRSLSLSRSSHRLRKRRRKSRSKRPSSSSSKPSKSTPTNGDSTAMTEDTQQQTVQGCMRMPQALAVHFQRKLVSKD